MDNFAKRPIDFITSRTSVKAISMTEPGPSDAELQEIIAAGLRVPDHGKIGPWRIQIVKKDAQKKLGKVYEAAFRKDNPTAPDDVVEFNALRCQRAPVMLVVTSYPDARRFDKVPHMEQRLSGGALCQNLLHGAHALGYAAQWLTGWPAYHADVKKALGHAPETEIIGFIFIGTSNEKPMERERVGADKVVSEWTGPQA
jgi:nitroreductase